MARLRLWCRRPAPARHNVAAARWRDERGFLMVALLVAMSVMAIGMSVALPTWRTLAQREKEAELIFRGEQYARAIALFQRRYANASPPNIDVLINEKFLRKKYLDPMTGEEFAYLTAGQPLPGEGQQPQSPATGNPSGGRGGGINLQPSGRQSGPAQPSGGGVGRGGIVGVVSKSTERGFRIYNGRENYNQWVFMGVQQSARMGGPGGAAGGVGPDGRGSLDGRGGRDGRGGVDGRGGRGNDGRGGRGLDGRGGRDGRGGLGGQQPPGRGQQPLPAGPGRF